MGVIRARGNDSVLNVYIWGVALFLTAPINEGKFLGKFAGEILNSLVQCRVKSE